MIHTPPPEKFSVRKILAERGSVSLIEFAVVATLIGLALLTWAMSAQEWPGPLIQADNTALTDDQVLDDN